MNNNTLSGTTVGGVTFGGGMTPVSPSSQNQVSQPAAFSYASVQDIAIQAAQADAAFKNDPALGPADVSSASFVDPIVTQTGNEFDDVMNGAQPVGVQPSLDAIPVQEQRQVTKSRLGVDFASPTHFDKPLPVAPKAEPTAEEKRIKELEEKTKKSGVLAGVLGFLMALSMIGCAVFAVLFVLKNDELTKQKVELETSKEIVAAVEKTTGKSINSAADVPVFRATTGYIYLTDWNIKIKIPDTLEKVSYILNENYRPAICFNAVQKGLQMFPEFANMAFNPGGMGCLMKVAVSEGSADASTGISFGTKVFTYKDYNYFYIGAVEYGKDAASLGLERTAIQIIKNMLTDNIEIYE